MGSLSTTLTYLDFGGHWLTRFPHVVMQLGALKVLIATNNDFAVLPPAITALSRLAELRLGRIMPPVDPQHIVPFIDPERRPPLDVRALGSLSSFPALRRLSLAACEVIVRESFSVAAQHPAIEKISFRQAHPAPGCAQTVQQLSSALVRMGRGSVLEFTDEEYSREDA